MIQRNSFAITPNKPHPLLTRSPIALQAIEIDPTDHVFFSNRSAAFLSKGEAAEALADAETCTGLKPTWGKGYGRKGAALFKQGKYDAAVEAYESGLKVEAGSEALASGLSEARAAAQNSASRRAARNGGGFPGAFPGGFPGGMGGMGQGQFGPGLVAKLATNPKFIPYLADPTFLAKLKALENDPNATATALGYALGQGFGGGGGDVDMGGMPPMKDPRMMEVVSFVLGAGREGGEEGDEGDDDEDMMGGKYEAPPQPPPSSSYTSKPKAAPPAPAEPPPPDNETPEEKSARIAKLVAAKKAVIRKEEGNALYKARKFDEALAAYRDAQAMNPEDMTFLLNEAAVHFEVKRFDECDAACRTAIERGRELRAPFATISKAFARLASSAAARGDLAGSVDLYESALLEHRTREVEEKLKKAKADMKELGVKAYLSPEKAVEAKDAGNVSFKAGDFKAAIGHYTEAIKRDPTCATYYQNRATAKAKLMEFPSALEDCNAALKIDPKFIKAINRKANCHFAMQVSILTLESLLPNTLHY